MSMAGLTPYLIRGGVVLALVLACFITVKVHDHNVIKAEQTREVAALKVASDKAVADVAADTQKLAVAAAQQKGQSDAQINALNARLADARRLLHTRASRPANQPAATTATPATCTGAGLFHEDADFLVREAASADTTQLDLDTCTKLYNNARDALARGQQVQP